MNNCTNVLKTLSLLFFLSVGTTQIQAQIYVDASASGANDGTSWADAYSNLEDALADTSDEEVWIAAGTYIPGGDSDDYEASFDIAVNKQLYGGFAGNETSLDDRDPEANETILSGDVAGDDVTDDFDTAKADNRRHVITVSVVDTIPDDAFESNVVFDGLIITGGNTEADTDLDLPFVSGGGIYSIVNIDVNACIFRNNYAARGASVFLAGNVDNSTFNLSVFENNRATSQSAGVAIRNAENVTVADCYFGNNQTTRGAFYPLRCNNVNVSDCVFESNITIDPEAFGGALFNWNCSNYSLTDCDFIGNSAGNGGCMYADYREFENPPLDNFVITGCTFEDNTATDFGAACIYFWNSSFTMTDCDFTGSVSANSAANLYMGGYGDNALIEDCTFEDGQSNFGSAFSHYADSTLLTVRGCDFTNNSAATSGTVIVGFKAKAIIEDCDFTTNLAQFGSAIYVQNDTTEITILDSDFTENFADGGSAVNVAADIPTVIDGNNFTGNSGAFGGAVNLGGSEGSDTETATVSNNIFFTNQATTQGGALNVLDRDVNIFNNVFSANTTQGDGFGGAISLNAASTENDTEVSLTNNTFYFNPADAATIGAFADDNGAVLTTTIQNNLFSLSTISDYQIEGGTPTLVTNGGNVSDNITLANFLNDFTQEHLAGGEIMFVDANGGDYNLLEGSYGIGRGVADGAPETDIEGNPRVATIDAGAYESPFDDPTAVQNVVANTGQLTLAPNPIRTTAVLNFTEDYRGDLTVGIVSAAGEAVRVFTAEKQGDMFAKELNVSDLPVGNYFLQVQFGQQIIVDKFTIIR